MARSFFAVALVALILLASATASSENDAGTGADASDDVALPTVLAAQGTFFGKLHVDDSDWYSVPADIGPQCATLDHASTRNNTYTLAVGTSAITAEQPAWDLASLTVAGPSTGTLLAGFTLPPLEPEGIYGFQLTSVGLADLGAADAGTGADAGGIVLGGAIPVDASCFSGRMTPLWDAMDAFSFEGQAGDTIYYSLGATSDDVLLTVANGLGRAVGPIVGSGDVGMATLPADGTYYYAATLSPAAPGPVDYIIGTIGGPPGPCRPMCL